MNTLTRPIVRVAAFHACALALAANPVPAQQIEEVYELLAQEDVLPAPYASSAAIDGHTAIVASRPHQVAHILDTRTGRRVHKLEPDVPDWWFGYSAAIRGEKAIVGAPNSGAAYVFDVVSGQQTAKLTLPWASEAFGQSVALSGDLALVGGAATEGGAGGVWVFDATTGSLLSQVQVPTGFPRGLAVSGTIGVVGDTYAASAWLFDATTGKQIAQLVPDEQVVGFGFAADISGSTAVVGCLIGPTFVFDVPTGELLRKFDTGYRYTALGLSGTTAIVGSWEEHFVHVFDTATGLELAQLMPSDRFDIPGFRPPFAIDGETAITYGYYGNASPYLFDLNPAIGKNYCGPAVRNSTGESAEIHAQGSVVAQDNAVRLVATQLPPHRPGYFLVSQAQDFRRPFGSNGYLCLGSPLGSYGQQVHDSGPNGVLMLELDLTTTPVGSWSVAVLAGETWNWQCCFQDVGNKFWPKTGTNFTDAVTVQFK